MYKCLILNFEKYILQRNLSVHTMYTLLMSYLIREQAIEYGFQNRLKNWRQKVDHRGIDCYHINMSFSSEYKIRFGT